VRVRWLRRALKNLDEEAEYIARDDPEAAARTVERIAASVERLASYPALGRPRRVAGTRELVIAGTAFVVPYRVRGETVEILRIFHAARNGRRRSNSRGLIHA
jgi:addiction module RelE/StbE family toxin